MNSNEKELLKKIHQLQHIMTQLEEQLLEAYDNGYTAGLEKGEKISNNAHTYIVALDSIRRFIKSKGYVYASGEPSNKGLSNQDVITIHSMICRALRLIDNE